MDVKNLNEVPAFTTKDGSEIRELLAHRNSAIPTRAWPRRAAAGHQHPGTLPPEGRRDLLHHSRSRPDANRRGGAEVKAGDAIAILPGQRHKLWNTGSETLRLLCCCAPAYEHSDTVLTD